MNKRPKRDPIKKLPLHEPGQSLREQIHDIKYEKVMKWATCILFGFLMVLLEWYRWFFNLPVWPVQYTVVYLLFLPFLFWPIVRLMLQADQLELGLKGERAVGHFLQNRLLRKGYWVVHDICEDGFNIDHALIGPTGVYAIETKTNSKPKGDAKVEYDGETVRVAGYVPDRNPVTQARACASSLSKILHEYSGQKVDVRPVVLYPGWYVNQPSQRVQIWVLNENHFVTYLNNEPKRLENDEIFKLAAALGRYVRDRDERPL